MTISVCDLASTRVVFGAGAVGRVAVEADDVGGSRILLLNSPSQAENTSRILELLGDRVVGRFDGARPHTPRPVTDQALKLTSGV